MLSNDGDVNVLWGWVSFGGGKDGEYFILGRPGHHRLSDASFRYLEQLPQNFKALVFTYLRVTEYLFFY